MSLAYKKTLVNEIKKYINNGNNLSSIYTEDKEVDVRFNKDDRVEDCILKIMDKIDVPFYINNIDIIIYDDNFMDCNIQYTAEVMYFK